MLRHYRKNSPGKCKTVTEHIKGVENVYFQLIYERIIRRMVVGKLDKSGNQRFILRHTSAVLFELEETSMNTGYYLW
jgi:hypothetical protein